MIGQRQTQGGPAPTDRRSRWGCFLVISALAFVLLAGPVISLFHAKPLRVSELTTYVTEPLKSDGQQIDYFARVEQEFYPDDMATDDNGFRMILQRVAMNVDAEPWHREAVFRKLGLDPANVPTIPYQEPSVFLDAYIASDQFDASAVANLQQKKNANLAPHEQEDTAEQEPDAGSEKAEQGDLGGSGQVDEFDDDPYGATSLELLEEALAAPWTRHDLPMMETWLEENGPALDVLAEAVRKPIFYVPMARKDESELLRAVLLPNMQAMRWFARGLNARANYRIGTGDVDGAIEDMVTCKRLGRHLGLGPTMIHLLVSIAIEDIADGIGVAGAPGRALSKAQLQRVVQEYDHLPTASDLAPKLRTKRYMTLDVLQTLAHDGQSWEEVLGVRSLPNYISMVGFDWNITAQRINEQFDALIEGGIEIDVPTRSEMKTALVSRSVRSRLLGDYIATLEIPPLDALQEAVHRNQRSERMKRIVLAMLLYQRDHGTLPPTYTVDEGGQPLHCWRVLLLPYLGQPDLHQKIRLDEPWDSEHNRAFHSEPPPPYRCPGDTASGDNASTYAVVTGPEMPFGSSQPQPTAPRIFPQVFLIEHSSNEVWMNPESNVPLESADEGILIEPSAVGILSFRDAGGLLGFTDGAVRFVPETMDIDVFRRVLRGESRIP